MRRPTAVHAHGFLTVNGQKMSKSRGTFITARRYLDHLPPEYLRYYFAAKLGPGIDDMDMNLEEFTTRLNSEIVGKLVNIASRCAGFITKTAGGRLADVLADRELYAAFVAAGDAIAEAYETRDTASAIREIMALADRANQFMDFAQALDAGQGSAQGGRGARRLYSGIESIQGADDLSAAGVARHGGQDAPVLSGIGVDLGARGRTAAGHGNRSLRAAGAFDSIPRSWRAWWSRKLRRPARTEPRRWAAQSDTATIAAAAAVEGNLISIDDFLRVDLRVAKVLERRAGTRRRQTAEAATGSWVNWAAAKSLPAFAPPTILRPWPAGSSSWSRIWSRAKCALALRRA